MRRAEFARRTTVVALGLLVALAHGSAAQAQEITCAQLLVQCGDGPRRQLNENGVISFVGGGTISTQCIGIVSGVWRKTDTAMAP